MAYNVPGFVHVIAQPTSLVCWATVYTMMRSWKDQSSYAIRGAVALVEEKYGVMVDNNRPLPSSEFGPFITKARMQLEPMANYPISEWEAMLRRHGLLWVGTLNSLTPRAGLHSRIIEGIIGSGTPDSTSFKIIDPAGGRRYNESFNNFLQRYEGAFLRSQGRHKTIQEYYQIRHF